MKTSQPVRLDHNWHTYITLPRTSWEPWKRYYGEVCPHGRQIVLVDGTHVRNTFNSDFSQGGNGYAYADFIPKNEIWIDWHIPEDEWPFIAFHECEEIEHMKKGDSYLVAHDKAKRSEDRFRHMFSSLYR